VPLSPKGVEVWAELKGSLIPEKKKRKGGNKEIGCQGGAEGRKSAKNIKRQKVRPKPMDGALLKGKGWREGEAETRGTENLN